MTEETCLTAKSFQRAFIAVKGIFLFLPMCFQVLSALLFFKILGMGRHSSTDFCCFCFFINCLAKSRQEPLNLQNLLNWCKFTAAAQMSRNPWNKEKRAHLHCIFTKTHVHRNLCRGKEKVAVGRSTGFQTLHSVYFRLVDWQAHCRPCETQKLLKTEALFQFWPSNAVCASLLQDLSWVCYESQPGASHPSQKLHFQILLRYLWGAGLCIYEKFCCSASFWDVAVQLFVDTLINYER